MARKKENKSYLVSISISGDVNIRLKATTESKAITKAIKRLTGKGVPRKWIDRNNSDANERY